VAEALLQLDDVAKRYGRGRPPALIGVSLRVVTGQVVRVAGGNGSGKTTLLRLAAGLTRPSAGSVVRGARSVGYVPDEAPEEVPLTPREYLAHVARIRRLEPADGRTRAAALAERLWLTPFLDQRVPSLSAGTRQKLALAQALLAPADLLVLDEPFSHLDAAAADALGALLAEAAAAGAGVLVADHGSEPLARLRPRTLTLGPGGGAGPPGAARRVRVVAETSSPPAEAEALAAELRRLGLDVRLEDER
jgi:ABC-type multidrug transport system ATPase subunit